MIAGPCLLGSSVNRVLGRHPNTSFEPGDLIAEKVKLVHEEQNDNINSASLEGEIRYSVPGRTVILQQSKGEMGAQQFTLIEKNMFIAATDFPAYDDRQIAGEKDEKSRNHYSDIRSTHSVYGLSGLYSDRNIANERIILKPN